MKRLSPRKIRSMLQVLTVNRDVADSLQAKGISRDDIAWLCEYAHRYALSIEEKKTP